MTDYTDQFERQLARRRKITAIVAVGLAAVGAIGAFLFVSAASADPTAPAPAQVELTRGEGPGLSAGCPEGWKLRGNDRSWNCSHPDEIATMCFIIPEPLPQSMPPSTYWKAAGRFVDAPLAEGSGPYEVNGRSTYRAVVEGALPQLFYVYTQDDKAYVVSCTAKGPRFQELLGTFDAIAQSVTFAD